jgi:hypothetical protein
MTIFSYLNSWIFNNKHYKDYNDYKNMSNIPRIIHQTAPVDINKWHPIWFKCQESWNKMYPEYTYMLWNDESMDNFMKKEFPQYYNLYKAYPRNIMRIDAARYFILYKYGGIYADMDYEVCHDFMHLIPPNMVSICESPYKENENCQNSLIISPKKHKFWKKVFLELEKSKNDKLIISVAGPQMIDRVVKDYKNKDKYINILPYYNYNPHKNGIEIMSDDPSIYTKHYGTSVWTT